MTTTKIATEKNAYVPDAAKIANHDRYDQSPRLAYIRSGAGNVHLGLRVDALGARSGLILRVSYVSACSGKQIGGAWGCTKTQDKPKGSSICPRCAKYAEKRGINLTAPLE